MKSATGKKRKRRWIIDKNQHANLGRQFLCALRYQ